MNHKRLQALACAAALMTTLSAEEVSFYPSASYMTNEGENLSVYADILYLTAKEEGLEFAAVMDAPVSIFSKGSLNVSTPDPTSFHSVNFDWHLGSRLGVAYHAHHDYWDICTEWLRYHHSETAHLNPDLLTQTLFISKTNPAVPGVGTIDNLATSAKEKWKLHYDTLDLNLIKSFWVTRRLAISPHAGLRTAWIHQTVKATYISPWNPIAAFLLPPNGTSLVNKNKNNFWGIGIRTGLNTRWAMTRRLSLFGNVGLTPLWSLIQTRGKQTLKNPIADLIPPVLANGRIVDLKNCYHTILYNADMKFGVQWDTYFTNYRYHLGFRAAWEFHYWPNQNQISRIDDSTNVGNFTPNAFYQEYGDLSLYGASFGIVFDF